MTNSLADIVVKATPGEWKVFDHYCGRDPETAGEEYANTRLIGLGQFDTIAEVRMGSDDVEGDFEANAELFAKAKSLATLVLEARKMLKSIHDEAVIANDVIRLGRDDEGSGRVKVATAMHRIAQRSAATLAKLESL
jgi:hypothetical protein